MRNFFTIIIALALASAWAAAGVKFNRQGHQFGHILMDDGPVSTEFTFVNTGDEPLHIWRVGAT